MTQQETGERTRGQTKVGTVAAVCLRKEKGIPKYPQSEVTIGEYGVEGDYHAGPMRTRSDGQVVPNTRHVTLVAKEVFDDLNRELDTDIPAGVVNVEGTPRTVAGDPLTTDANKCQLKPLSRSDYGGITFTDAEWGQLQQIFPKGVCDYSKPGVDQ